MAAQLDVALRERQLLAARDADLLLHDVDAGDHLGHRMLDLHARVHLDEVELAVLVQELEGAGAASSRSAGRPRRSASPISAISVAAMPGAGRLLDHLLVAALHRAVALPSQTALPWLSASTWISTWRGFSRNFSM